MSRGEFEKGHDWARQAAQIANQDFHATLAPMKETIRSQGLRFGDVSHHLKKNSLLIFGKKMSKKDILSWAAKRHDADPENFIKSIGL